MVKFQYFNILRCETSDVQTWYKQFRLGFQFQLKQNFNLKLNNYD